MLDEFLRSVERSAYRMARIALRDDDEALDMVQEAMIRLVRKYADRPLAELKPLFFRILQNQIRDCQRRRMVRSRVMAFFGRANPEEYDPVDLARDPGLATPEKVQLDQTMHKLEGAVRALPARQQQAFLLRAMEGLDVKQTADAMGCSSGSVKTHYSRAVHALRAKLDDYW